MEKIDYILLLKPSIQNIEHPESYKTEHMKSLLRPERPYQIFLTF